ncbi:hypothetical protein Leryth_025511 [Lithospermum erythrorhizon]|nr:hypothetical protein Leryth_025511 [Lithospermum erythrorhizon]
MGVLIDSDEIKEAKNDRDIIQHFTIENFLCISLWNEMITAEGNALVQATKDHSIIVAKRLTIKSYGSN